MNWALEGLGRLIEHKNRFTYLKAASEAVTLMRDLASPVAAFVRERCEFGTDKEVSPELLYSTYKGWSDDNGHIKKDKATFGRDLRAAHPSIKRMRPREGGRRVYVYAGITLRVTEHDEEAEEEAA